MHPSFFTTTTTQPPSASLQMRAFVLKFPLGISYPPGLVRMWIERFRQLCFTRDEWTRTLQLEMTPSLMAFFLKDAGDQLLRLEYLASTGDVRDGNSRGAGQGEERLFRGCMCFFWDPVTMSVQWREGCNHATEMGVRGVKSNVSGLLPAKWHSRCAPRNERIKRCKSGGRAPPPAPRPVQSLASLHSAPCAHCTSACCCCNSACKVLEASRLLLPQLLLANCCCFQCVCLCVSLLHRGASRVAAADGDEAL